MLVGLPCSLVAIALLAACVTQTPRAMLRPPLFSGKSVASALLKADTFEAVSAMAMATAKCRSVDAVETNIVDVSQDYQVSQTGLWLKGAVQERWIVTLCDQRLPYRIIFSPDGKGGTYMRIAPSPS